MQKGDIATRLSLVPIFGFTFLAYLINENIAVYVWAGSLTTWIFLNGVVRTPNTSFEENSAWLKEKFQRIEVETEQQEHLTTLSV
ncbi:MAG: hypothetical protein AAB501_02415 [Patescibacteria group bacterium]